MNYPKYEFKKAELLYNYIKDGKTDLAKEILTSLRLSELQQFQKQYKSIVKLAEKEKHVYMITYTISERKDEFTDEDYQNMIIEDLSRKSLKGIKCHVVKEYTKKGMPHWHSAIQSTRYLKKELFNSWKNYGFVDCSISKTNNYMEVLNYISKESKPIKIY